MKIQLPATVLLGCAFVSSAWGAQPPPPPVPPASAREGAAVDITGYWVAQVVEDWRMRMITPPRGDADGIVLTPAAVELANRWDLEADNARGEQCKAFGAGAIMRQPTRLRISWQDDNTLKIETDNGQQTRLFRFSEDPAARNAARSWQGYSAARWISPPARQAAGGLTQAVGLAGATVAATDADTAANNAANNAFGSPSPGSLAVVTNNLRAGYLRKNGIPYSETATVREFYDRFSMFGADYLQVVTQVEDPVYLQRPYVVSNQFKREPDGSKWNPQPCSTDPPTVAEKPRVMRDAG